MKRKYTKIKFTEEQMQRILDQETKDMFDRLGLAALVAVSQGKDLNILNELIQERNKILKAGYNNEGIRHHRSSLQRVNATVDGHSTEIS